MALGESDIILAPLFLEWCKCFYGQSVTQPPHQSIGKRHILHNYPAWKYVRSFTNSTYISPLLMASNCHPHSHSHSHSFSLPLPRSASPFSAYFFHSSQFREYINTSSANSYRSHIHSLCFFSSLSSYFSLDLHSSAQEKQPAQEETISKSQSSLLLLSLLLEWADTFTRLIRSNRVNATFTTF